MLILFSVQMSFIYNIFVMLYGEKQQNKNLHILTREKKNKNIKYLQVSFYISVLCMVTLNDCFYVGLNFFYHGVSSFIFSYRRNTTRIIQRKPFLCTKSMIRTNAHQSTFYLDFENEQKKNNKPAKPSQRFECYNITYYHV